MGTNLLNSSTINILSDSLFITVFVFIFFLGKFEEINQLLEKRNRVSYILYSFLLGLCILSVVVYFREYIDISNFYVSMIMATGLYILFLILFPLTLYSMFRIVLSAKNELNMYYQNKESLLENRSSLSALLLFWLVATPFAMTGLETANFFYLFSFCALIYSLNCTKKTLLNKKMYYPFE